MVVVVVVRLLELPLEPPQVDGPTELLDVVVLSARAPQDDV